MATIEQLVKRIEEKLYLASGIGTQIHFEDTAIDNLRSTCNQLFKDRWWAHLLVSTTYTADGVTGHTVEPNTDIVDFDDIKDVFIPNEPYPISRINLTSNPFHQYNYRFGPALVATRMFRLVPPTYQGEVAVVYRKGIPNSVWEDAQYTVDIPFDEELLIAKVCLMYARHAEISAQSIEDFNETVQRRYKALVANDLKQTMNKDEDHCGIPTDWR